MDRARIGQAADFYRIRLRRLDAGGAPDLEWRDDILYREPPSEGPGEQLLFVVEAVELDQPDRAYPLGSYADYEAAVHLRKRAEEELDELTRSQFEASWFPSAGGGEAAD
jgi:hypothetical protein